MKKPTKINTAEAIIQPYWDGQISPFHQYSAKANTQTKVTLSQFWCAGKIEWHTTVKSEINLEVTNKVRISIDGYDRIILSASIPKSLTFSLAITTEKGIEHPIKAESGTGTITEYSGPIKGQQIKKITFIVLSDSEQSGVCMLYWLGVANSTKLKVLADSNQSETSTYWDKLLTPTEDISQVQLGTHLLFDTTRLKEIRQLIKKGPYKKIYQSLKTKAEASLTIDPHRWINDFVIINDRKQFIRSRYDRNHDLTKPAIVCSFVGLVEDDPKIIHHGAKCLVALASSDKWYESFMTEFTSSTWRHASFSESLTTETCALVLDWASSAFTPHGKRWVLNRMYTKGISRIKREFFERDYYRYVNPAMVFMRALSYGLVTMAHEFPHMKREVYWLEKDLHHMYRKMLLADGGVSLSATYWNKKIGPALLAFDVLQQYHQKLPIEKADRILEILRPMVAAGNYDKSDVKSRTIKKVVEILSEERWEKLVRLTRRGANLVRYQSPSLRSSQTPRKEALSAYIQGMLSTTGNTIDFLPIGDRTTSSIFDQAILFLANKSDDWFWKDFRYQLLTKDLDIITQSHHSSIIALIYGQELSQKRKWKRQAFTLLPHSGHVTSVRYVDNQPVLFHLSGRPQNGDHMHDDVGSIILEYTGEDIFIDRGSPSYTNPNSALFKRPEYHNLITPLTNSKADLRQTLSPKTMVTPTGEGNTRDFRMAVDLAHVWEKQFKAYTRSIYSKNLSEYEIQDRIDCRKPMAVQFHLHSPFPFQQGESEITLKTSKRTVRIIPNWETAEIKIFKDSVDYRDRDIYHLVITSKVRDKHSLSTKIIIS